MVGNDPHQGVMVHNMREFTKTVIDIIGSIPEGKVLSYGKIAKMAGNARAARQVARILHTLTVKFDLPWHRVINSQGNISFTDHRADVQRDLLLSDGVAVSDRYQIDLTKYSWFSQS